VEIIMDCGAFGGDTFRAFLSKSGDVFKQYIIFGFQKKHSILIN